ncbi:hypothetical protein [Lysinibacillus xylanilyticus]|uniref:hypothetical protein n=1 Tax=Lysinibacillus xylanilyticus TaxID=582475 RepID=UPI003D08942C
MIDEILLYDILFKIPSKLLELESFEKLLSAGDQTSSGIEELSLRTPLPVAIYLCESAATTHD